MPTHSGLRVMEERARKALEEDRIEPTMPHGDSMVRVKARSKGQSYHFVALRSQVGQLMGA